MQLIIHHIESEIIKEKKSYEQTNTHTIDLRCS